MKRILLGTSALCAVAVAGPTFAQSANEPIKLGIGGYWNSAYGDILSQSGANATNRRHDDVNTDAVLNFKGSSKLDNGLTVGLSVQIRAENTFTGASNAGDLTSSIPDTIKRSYGYIRSDFGEVRIGDDDDARRQKAMTAPVAGQGLMGANTPDMIVMNNPGLRTNTTQKTISTSKRVTRLAYFSPTIAGFSFGASYAPGGEKSGIGETNTGGTTPTNSGPGTSFALGTNAVNNEFSFAGAYSGKFGDFSLDAYAGISEGHRVIAAPTTQLRTGRDNPFAGSGGGVVGWGPIKFGAAYEYLQDRDLPVGGDGHTSRKTWDIGPEYIMGPFSVSLDWTRGLFYNNPNPNSGARLDWISLAFGYIIGPGISVEAAVDYTHWAANQPNSATTTSAANNYNGLGALVGLGLSF